MREAHISGVKMFVYKEAENLASFLKCHTFRMKWEQHESNVLHARKE